MLPKLHILNLGAGVESVAILLRWIEEPGTRPFKSWKQLLVLTAQTGDEMLETKFLMERYLMPLMRLLGIRYVQVCKRTASKKDGYVLLDDTIAPFTFFARIEEFGGFSLSSNWKLNGTAQRVSRPHICAQRFKGEVLDEFIQNLFLSWQLSAYWVGELALLTMGLTSFACKIALEFLIASLNPPIFGPYLGYNSDEAKRSAKADGYSCRGTDYVYPLQEWGWNRQKCIDYIFELFQVIWRKSACEGCVFLSKEEAPQRYQRDPQAGANTLLLETNTLAFNPRLPHFGNKTAMQVIVQSGNLEAIRLYEQLLEQTGFAVYHVRRIFKRFISKTSGKPKTDALRWTKKLAEGTRSQMEQFIKALAQEHNAKVIDWHGKKVFLIERKEGVFSTCEEFFCLAPNLAMEEKCRNPRKFPIEWAEITATETLEQIPLTLISSETPATAETLYAPFTSPITAPRLGQPSRSKSTTASKPADRSNVTSKSNSRKRVETGRAQLPLRLG